MKCVNPRKLPNPNAVNGVTDSYIKVSCGKCYACLANRRRSWLFRLRNELDYSVGAVFCTFTYDEENRPYVLQKPHMQKFFKRLRKKEDFTYYCIGEYGTHTKREHYHSVIFFKSMPGTYFDLDYFERLVKDNWPYGNVMVSRVTVRRLNYVLHYHTRPKQIGSLKTFALYSKGLGIHFLNDDVVNYMDKTRKFVLRDYEGGFFVLPRYYRKKISELYNIDLTGSIDNTKEYLEELDNFYQTYGKMPWQMPKGFITGILHDKFNKDMDKLNNYNKQDKFY